MSEQQAEKEPSPSGEEGETDGAPNARLAAAVSARGAVHSNGLIGGIGLKAVDLDLLHKVAEEPEGRATLVEVVIECVQQAMEKAGITYGVQDEELQKVVDEFIDGLARGEDKVVTSKIAEGEAPEAGTDGWIEYSLNYQGRPFRELADLKPNSTRKNCKVVHAEDVLAVLHPPTSPKKGTSVRGETLESPAGSASKPPPLKEIAGDRTVISDKNLLAECDGVCEEDAEGHLRVVPEIVLDRVDETTGRVPESGISQANVVVTGDIKGQGVATAENLFAGVCEAGGTIEGRASIQARNLVLHGRIVGERDGNTALVEVEDICAVEEVVNRAVSARHILILRDSQFARLDAESGAWVDGNLRGGLVNCRSFLQVLGDVGTEAGGSHTHITLPAEAVGEHHKKKMTTAVHQYKDQLQTLQGRMEELNKHSDKRSKADSYWAKLLQGERRPPRGPLQMKSLQQFVEFIQQKQTLGRQIKGIKQALGKLAAEKKEAEESTANSEATVGVGGTLYLDVSFEINREMGSDDGEIPVSFEHEGNHFKSSTLAKASSVLRKQVSAYREQQESHISEKQAAIDQMFEGQDKKPTVQQMEDKVFELPVRWVEEEESEDLVIQSMLYVRAREPQKVMVRSTARIKEPREDVTVLLKAEGVKGSFTLQPSSSPPASWTEDENIRENLESIMIREVSALEVLRGAASPTTQQL